jgi:hypothetical protein
MKLGPMSRNATIVLVTLIICTTVLIWGFLLWPTPFQYEKVKWGPAERLYEINRITGTIREIKVK